MAISGGIGLSAGADALRFATNVAQGVTLVQADLDGGGTADFTIQLDGLTTLARAGSLP